jgi:ribosomal silencing factor RsfS
MNVKGKETMISKLTEVLLKIPDRYKASKFIPLSLKNNLTKQIVILRENKSSQVETINNNSNDNCDESKKKLFQTLIHTKTRTNADYPKDKENI